jgi:DnaJ-domain-containing protein 1
MEQMMERMVAATGRVGAKSGANLKEIRAGQEHLKEEIRASQELLKKEMMAKLDSHHKGLMARMATQLEKMEACLEKMEVMD